MSDIFSGEPTTEEMTAIKNYARRWGRYWKEKLATQWWDGSDAAEIDGYLLRRVRNNFGPAWLEQQPEIYK